MPPKKRKHASETNEHDETTSHNQPFVLPMGNIAILNSAIPKKIIVNMASAGAERLECPGGGPRIMRIEGVDSKAWKLYKTWACSIGEVGVIVCTIYAPPRHIQESGLCSRNIRVMMEYDSILRLVAPLLMENVSAALPLSGPFDPGHEFVSVRHAGVSVTALVQTISNPGENFPGINAMSAGHYICHLLYRWKGAIVEVPIFRS